MFKIYTFVVWSSEISLRSGKFNFNFSIWVYVIISKARLHFVENSIKIGQLAPAIWVIKDPQKNDRKQKSIISFVWMYVKIKEIFTDFI